MEAVSRNPRRIREYSYAEDKAGKRSRANLTENEEGQEYFLCQCQMYVTEDFLTYSDEDENPVWGSILQYVHGHHQADDIIGTNEELFDFLRPCFSPYVLQRIDAGLADSESSSLGLFGPPLLKRGTYLTFVKALIADILDELSDAQKSEASSSHEAERGSPHVHGETKAFNDTDVGGEDALNIPAGDDGDSAPGDPLGGEGDDPTAKLYFQRANETRREVTVGTFLTPPKPPKPPRLIKGKPDVQEVQCRVHLAAERTRTIRSRSLTFCEQVKLQFGLPIPEYAPGKQCAGDLVWIFHGTRVKNLQSFGEFGIWLEDTHRSDFSREKAFYLSNSFRYAYEHVLLNVIRNFHHNYVLLYCFLVPFGELEGIVESERRHINQSGQSGQSGQSSQSTQKLDRKIFFDGTPEWKAFLKHNWETPKVRPSSPTKDLIIGPIGVVEWIGRGANRQRTYRPVTWENGDMPFQLAFRTPASWSWLARHLQYCYEEVRLEGESAQPVSC